MNIAEIARRANVSTATVSRTLNQSGPVKAATAKKVWRAVTELNYYPNSHARALVSGRSRLIGLIVSDITNPFFPELIEAFQGLAAEKQYDVLLTSTDYLTERMAECLRRMLERKVDGVAMMTSEMDLSLIKELGKRNVPIVFMDVRADGPSHEPRRDRLRQRHPSGRQPCRRARSPQHRLHQRTARSALPRGRVGSRSWMECASTHPHAGPQNDPRGYHTAEGGQHAMASCSGCRSRQRPSSAPTTGRRSVPSTPPMPRDCVCRRTSRSSASTTSPRAVREPAADHRAHDGERRRRSSVQRALSLDW